MRSESPWMVQKGARRRRNMVLEPRGRSVGLSGCARYRVNEADFSANQGGTASIFVALGFCQGRFFDFKEVFLCVMPAKESSTLPHPFTIRPPSCISATPTAPWQRMPWPATSGSRATTLCSSPAPMSTARKSRTRPRRPVSPQSSLWTTSWKAPAACWTCGS